MGTLSNMQGFASISTSPSKASAGASSSRFPMYVLGISCPGPWVDILFLPDKTMVEFTRPARSQVAASLNACLKNLFLRLHPSLVPIITSIFPEGSAGSLLVSAKASIMASPASLGYDEKDDRGSDGESDEEEDDEEYNAELMAQLDRVEAVYRYRGQQQQQKKKNEAEREKEAMARRASLRPQTISTKQQHAQRPTF
jgi:DNA mismatch repair ATPase MutL